MRKYNFNASPVKNFFKKNGFYCALALAITGLGISAYSVISTTKEILTPEPLGTVSETPAQNVVSGVEKTESVIYSEIEEQSKAESKVPSEEKKELGYPTCFMMPVEGEVIKDYSDSEMVFNTTLNDWRAHNAVDFKSPAGTPVKAIADGIVEKITFDESYGYMIEINHGGGLKAKYCNLQRDVLVKEGDEVEIADVIGSVGDESYMEFNDGAHLHLETYLKDAVVDPLEILGVRE